MKFVLTARSGDWHVTRARGKGVWSAARTLGEALRMMQRQARCHGHKVSTMEVVVADDSWTRRVIEAPRLIANSEPLEVVVDDDVEYVYYYVRDTWTDELKYIAKCPVGYHPVWPMGEACRAEPCSEYDYEQMDAFGMQRTGMIPDKWCGPIPRLSLA